jgi:Uma2 family endonuclease
MPTTTDDFVTEEAYLVAEPQSEYKSEYRRGRVVAMAGASDAHMQISSNIHGELYVRLKGSPCRVFTNDVRVRASEGKYYTYPDVAVVCGKVAFRPPIDTLENPTLIIEVLSPSTEAYDRGEKFEAYKTIPTLREYVLVRQDRVHVERFVRQTNGAWVVSAVDSLDAEIAFEALGCQVPVKDVYAGVTFLPADNRRPTPGTR